MRTMRAATCSALLTVSACAGNGDGLDENGRPAGEAMQQPLEPTFASIQAHVFTPICTACHAGAAAPLGLRLDEGASYAMLVNAPSVEVASLLRVAPGDPDASYLIQKLEGVAAVGARMPLGGPPLPPATIAVIRQWIADGAQPPAAVLSGKAATINAAWPVQNAVLQPPPREIVLGSSVELDTTLLHAGVVTVRRSGGDGDFSNGGERAVTAVAALRSLAPTVFAVSVAADEWVPDVYELRVSGSAPLALADRSARPIDGDGDGAAGGDFVLHFTVEAAR